MARCVGVEALNARSAGTAATAADSIERESTPTMIESVHIRDLGVIVNAEVECGPGLTVITGETGAGKTMLLTGLGLLWGERADPSRVRQGSRQARVDGVVRIHDPQTRERLQVILDEVGGQWDDDALIVSRTVHAEGRSRAHLAGRTVPAGVLVDVANHLVAVHGQDDQMRLRSSRHQRIALDSYAGRELAAALDDYQVGYVELKAAIQRRTSITEEALSRQREAEDLRALLALVDDVEPQPGESAQLRTEADRLAHVDHIAAALDTALHALREESLYSVDSATRRTSTGPGVADALAQARAALSAVATHDPRISALTDRLAEIATLLSEVIVDLAGLASSTDADPARLEFIENRRASLAALRRRVALVTGLAESDEEDLLRWAESARVRLAELDDDPAQVRELDERIERLRDVAGVAAARVSHLRSQAARELADRVTQELASLAMPRARLVVRVAQRPPGEGIAVMVEGNPVSADRSGVDDVSFELAGHDDGEARPLSKGASGGERSRIMLALEVVLASSNPVPTMVFDEVDVGVGGRAAVEVGRRLARLARHTQVLVVTHLPQVAAFADAHLVVRADPDGQVTQTSVEAVDGEARQRELARMLAGLEDSATAMAHARELLDLAETERTGAERTESSPPRDAAAGRDTPAKRRSPTRGR